MMRVLLLSKFGDVVIGGILEMIILLFLDFLLILLKIKFVIL